MSKGVNCNLFFLLIPLSKQCRGLQRVRLQLFVWHRDLKWNLSNQNWIRFGFGSPCHLVG